MVNVHALGGRAMLEAARAAVNRSEQHPLLVAVTVLTSIDQQALTEIGIAGSIEQTVLRLAGLAKDCSLDGVVCSALETPALRRVMGTEFCLVTPGIRLAASGTDDQSRVATPAEALRQGSNYLVIGRPITQAADPLLALHRISTDIQGL
jgi:orotidine-5'-phosphate decarboxylase